MPKTADALGQDFQASKFILFFFPTDSLSDLKSVLRSYFKNKTDIS